MASGALAAHPSFFECVTAMAFLAFAEHRVDFAVYEVGMGGRFDATNIVRPEIAVITPIDFDHENFLGHSIEEIAGEKAGIVKPGAWVVTSAERPEARAVIARRCKELDARLFEVDDWWRIVRMEDLDGRYHAEVSTADSDGTLAIEPPLPGRFQIRNALTAATASRLLARRGFRITDEAIKRGIAATRWPGRLERLASRPALYLDGTHNPAGARELLNFWKENFAGRRILLVYGAMRDKAVDEIALPARRYRHSHATPPAPCRFGLPPRRDDWPSCLRFPRRSRSFRGARTSTRDGASRRRRIRHRFALSCRRFARVLG
jgi:dihydrofolate synthase/folylpolyglutamate synthase